MDQPGEAAVAVPRAGPEHPNLICAKGALFLHDFQGASAHRTGVILPRNYSLDNILLIGKAAGENITIGVTFPENYQTAHLAGKTASFATVVLSVGKPETANDEGALAKMLNFEDKGALRANLESHLGYEAEQLKSRDENRINVKKRLD